MAKYFLEIKAATLCCVCAMAQKQCKQILATIRREMYDFTHLAFSSQVKHTQSKLWPVLLLLFRILLLPHLPITEQHILHFEA